MLSKMVLTDINIASGSSYESDVVENFRQLFEMACTANNMMLSSIYADQVRLREVTNIVVAGKDKQLLHATLNFISEAYAMRHKIDVLMSAYEEDGNALDLVEAAFNISSITCKRDMGYLIAELDFPSLERATLSLKLQG